MIKLALAALILSCGLGVVAFGQQTDRKAVPADDIMQQVVSRILRFQFKPRRSPTAIPLAQSQVKSEWLPEIKNVTFTLIPDERILDYENGVFLFEEPVRDGNVYSINVGWGDLDCFGTGNTWKFRISVGRLRLWPSGGWGRGCGSFGSDPPVIRGLDLGEISPNEIKGYEFFAKGRVKSIRIGLSTEEEMRQILGDSCKTGCDFDATWTVRAEYISDGIAWTRTIGDDETQFVAKQEFVGKLGSLSFYPKQPISFSRIVFPSNRFSNGKSMAIGDAWGINGFEGAVHTSYYKYADGYGLTYTVYDEETFNNLLNRPSGEKARKKGDLIEIEYAIPESLEDKVYDRRLK